MHPKFFFKLCFARPSGHASAPLKALLNSPGNSRGKVTGGELGGTFLRDVLFLNEINNSLRGDHSL